MDTNSQHEFAWDAFCYLAGEMTPAEQSHFEAILADDQQAREALAQAVELTQATYAALSPVPKVASPAQRPIASSQVNRRSASQHWTWMALGAAVCLLLMFGWHQVENFYQPPGPSDEQLAAKAENARALALRWTEVRQQSDAFVSTEDWALDEADMAPSDDELADDAFASPSAPEWMLAAAAQARASDMMIDGMERGIEPPQDQ